MESLLRSDTKLRFKMGFLHHVVFSYFLLGINIVVMIFSLSLGENDAAIFSAVASCSSLIMIDLLSSIRK